MSAKALRIPALLCLGAQSLFLTPPALGQAQAQAVAPTTGEAAPEGLSKGDWAGIRAAYEAGRHAAYSVEGGYQARNPGQGWRTHFDGRGFLTQPDAGGWTWGLELERYGFAGREQEVTRPARVSAEGGRVAYAWDAFLEEWYENDARGLEHGYTVHRRPARGEQDEDSPLTFTLAVRGKLRPDVDAGGRGVRFLNEGGAAVLAYTGLTVLDADGRELSAGFEVLGDGGARLLLSVDERGARYPLVIDPLAQQAYLKASNPDAGDWFGRSVAVSGDTVVVSGQLEDSNATGVNGNQGDNSASNSGAVYVFVRSGAGWSQEAYLKASNNDVGDEFGWAVAVSGDRLVVAAIGEDSGATGVNGNQGDNVANGSGAAYIFARSGTSWSQEAYIKASNTQFNDSFGHAVAISGDTVVVSTRFEDSSASGVNGNQGDNSTSAAGAVYLFRLGLGTTYCTAGPNSTGAPAAISASGSASVAANDLLLRAEPVPDQPGVFFYGPQQTSTPFGNGTLCITGQIARLDVVTAVGNVMTFMVDNTSPPSLATLITVGSTWNFQAWFRDPLAGGAFFDLSDGLALVFGP